MILVLELQIVQLNCMPITISAIQSTPLLIQLLRNPQSDFHIIEQVLTDLKLLLNPKKTKCMLFTRLSPSSVINSSISTLNGTPIERVSNYQYLGIWIDDKLSFKIHIYELTEKLKSKWSFFYRNISCFTLKYRKHLVQATFSPLLDYADVIYMHAAVNSEAAWCCVLFCTRLSTDGFRTHHCVLYDKVSL